MTLPLPANWVPGNSFTAAAENNVETVVNALGAGTIPIPRYVNSSGSAPASLATTRNVYVYTGTGGTWTLPAVSGNTGAIMRVYNKGTGALVVQAAGSDHIYDQSAITSFTLSPGNTTQVLNDGSHWLKLDASAYDLSLIGFGAQTPRNAGNPTFDSSGSSADAVSTTMTWTHPFTPLDRAILIGVTTKGFANTPAAWTRSVTVGGHACTTTGVDGATAGTLGELNLNNTTSSSATLDLWGLVLPSSLWGTAATISVSYTGPGTPHIAGCSAAYTNVAAFNGVQTAFGNTTSITSGTVTTTTSGTVAAVQAIVGGNTISNPSGYQSVYVPPVSSAYNALQMQDNQGSTGTSATLTATGGAAAAWASVAVNMTRLAPGTGDNPFGVSLQRAVTLSSVTYRCLTPDASGNLVCQLNRNGSAISGTSTTIAAANQVAGATTAFTQACSPGDVITLGVTAVGTSPGYGLIADIAGNA